MAQQDSAKLPGQRLDALLQRVALPGERDFRARVVACLGDAPGDRAVVGDAEDHPAFTLHQACFLRHPVSNRASVWGSEVHQHSSGVEPKFASGLTLFDIGLNDRNRRLDWVLCWVRRSRRTTFVNWCQ
jgi:hypothetical protein